MKVVIAFFFGILAVASAQMQTDCMCASPHIDLEERIRLNAKDNDYNGDGIVTFKDVYYDIAYRYDNNPQDGFGSEAECVARWGCAYADTPQATLYHCMHLLFGQERLDIMAYNTAPLNTTGIPISYFKASSRSRWMQFYNDRCINKAISVDEKVDLMAGDDTNSYDSNNDGFVTQLEFLVKRACAYADSGDFARSLWNQFSQGSPTVAVANLAVLQYDAGTSLDAYKTTSRGFYDSFSS